MRRRACGSGPAPRLKPPILRRYCRGWTGPRPKSPPHLLRLGKDISMLRVLISDKLSPASVDIFRNRGIDVDLKPGLSPAEQRAIIGEYDGLAIRSATKVTK